jgi:hypothetical protein
MRFDGHRYIDCRWCHGRGCLACESEAEKAYRRDFPEGPKPLATFRRDDPRIRELLGPEAMNKHFGPGGGGITAFIASLPDDSRGDGCT